MAQRRPTLYLGQGVADQNPEWMLEFWNRSITTVSSLDGTIGGPGPSGGPNIAADGRLYWGGSDPSIPGKTFDFAVEEWPCVDFAGTVRGVHPYRAGGKVRLSALRLECAARLEEGDLLLRVGRNRHSLPCLHQSKRPPTGDQVIAGESTSHFGRTVGEEHRHAIELIGVVGAVRR